MRRGISFPVPSPPPTFVCRERPPWRSAAVVAPRVVARRPAGTPQRACPTFAKELQSDAMVLVLSERIIMMRSGLVSLVVLFATAFPAAIPDPVNPEPQSPRPIDAVDTVFLEDLTWMEIRDAMKAGKDTAIVATGGI